MHKTDMVISSTVLTVAHLGQSLNNITYRSNIITSFMIFSSSDLHFFDDRDEIEKLAYYYYRFYVKRLLLVNEITRK